MEDVRFELFSDTVYTLILLLKRHFLPSARSHRRVRLADKDSSPAAFPASFLRGPYHE